MKLYGFLAGFNSRGQSQHGDAFYINVGSDYALSLRLTRRLKKVRWTRWLLPALKTPLDPFVWLCGTLSVLCEDFDKVTIVVYPYCRYVFKLVTFLL